MVFPQRLVHPSCRRRPARLEFQAELRNGRNQVRLYKEEQQTYVVKIRVWMGDCSPVDTIVGSPMKMQIQHEKFYRKPYDSRVRHLEASLPNGQRFCSVFLHLESSGAE
jgi:hypothetical protein